MQELIVIKDSFTDVNATPINNHFPEIGNQWQDQEDPSGGVIQSNQLSSPGYANLFNFTKALSANCYAQIKWFSGDLYLIINGAGNYLRIDSGDIYINNSLLIGIPAVSGKTYKISRIDNRIYAFEDGILIGSQTAQANIHDATSDFQLQLVTGVCDSYEAGLTINSGDELNPPKNFAVQPISTTRIDLSWDKVDGILGYKLERSLDNISWTQIYPELESLPNAVSYSDTGLTAGTLYFYRISTKNLAGYTAPSEVKHTTTLPSAPTLNELLQDASSEIDLSWDNILGNTGYKIERKKDTDENYTQIAIIGANIIGYEDKNISLDTHYYYRIRAFNSGGNSAYSNIEDITTIEIRSRPKKHYLGLITSQYQNSANLLSWLSALLKMPDDLTHFLETFDSNFDIDKAIGNQLDILGEILGRKRTVSFQPSNSVSPILTDDVYRILLKAKIFRNHWDGRINSIMTMWQELFPGGNIYITDNANMSFSVILSGAFSSIILDLIENDLIIPRPEGILINYSYSTAPFFGWDKDDAYIAGWDTGHWT